MKDKERFDNRLQKRLNAQFIEKEDDIIKETKNQLNEYFNQKRTDFSLPLHLAGTDFQKKVWQALLKVPYGTTASYLQLAKDIGNEKAVRAVANANGANPISFIVPCHRIIGSNGELVGYGGGLPLKKYLLELEHSSNSKKNKAANN